MMDKFDFDFMAVNESDYRLEIEMQIKGFMVSMAFDRAKEAFKARMPKDAKIDKVESFEVDRALLNTLSTNSGPIIRAVRKQVQGDGIKILSRWVESAKFVKVGKDWKVKVIFNGVYSKC